MSKTIREAYGEALARYGKDDPRVVVLDADVTSSTKSGLFAAACPDRFFNIGIAEANMAAMAAGLASEGKIPFVNTFAVFIATLGTLAARTFAGYGNLNIKFMGAYGGMSDAYDGASHHSIEDIAVMRAIPNIETFVASDAVQTAWLVKNAVASPHPMYIRLSRDAMPALYGENETFETGRAKVLRDGGDVTIFACGVMCGAALAAADALAGKGVSARVVDMFTIKPLDADMVAACAVETRALVTAEEHNIVGGLGGAVAEALAGIAKAPPLRMVGIRDRFTESGGYAALLEKYGLDPASVAKEAMAALSLADAP